MSGIEYLSVLRKIENEFVLVIFDGREFQRREPASLRGGIIYPLSLHKAFSNTFVVQNTDELRGKIEKKVIRTWRW